ncbi:MAG: single-stranded-DNA-specific exonuclease RecJ [Candidatus Pacebacteria bacterium]|nr:single-stranded-DNA-specific exonuclease RecJ [Candidatus Paceibacterota bacterium]
MRWRVLGHLRSSGLENRQKEIIEILFKNREIMSMAERKTFLDPSSPELLSLSTLKINQAQVKKAVNRIKKAVAQKEKVIVYGDYDADGICAAAILWETLHHLKAKAMPHIPDRIKEGYGLNVGTIKNLKKKHPDLKLLITVDQGITAGEKIKFAQKLGLETIVTDHHVKPKTKCPALAVVHTTLLSGSGVAWILARELSKSFPARIIPPGEILRFLELVAIGTITDLLPVTGPNRSLITHGLGQLQKTRRLGLETLMKEAGIEAKSLGIYEVGFGIGPRLNASGRIDDPLDSLRLLCTRSRSRARSLAQKINLVNRRRQELMAQTAQEAREAWLAQRVAGAKLIFVNQKDWDQGVIGLAASKLAEEFYLPVIVVSQGDKESKASARSINGFNIIEAIREAENLLIDAGGHPMAAGFTAETQNLDKLKEKLITIAEQRLDSRILEKTLKVDCEVRLSDLNLALFNRIQEFSPFGIGNPQPDFTVRGAEVIETRLVGRGQKHLKMTVRDAETKQVFDCIGFGLSQFHADLSPGQKIDLAFSLILNEWNGRKNLELKVKDIKTS